jgi:hypothetical protein
MTVDPDDPENLDDLDDLAGVVKLPTYDISPRRARDLRRRCHAMLTAAPLPKKSAPFARIVIPALGGAWCLAYLIEILRCTEAIYRYVGVSLTSR